MMFSDELKKAVLHTAIEGRLVRQIDGEFVEVEDAETIEFFYNNSLPDNWKYSKLGSIASIVRGRSPKPIKEYLTTDIEGTNWIMIGDAAKGHKYINKTKHKISSEGRAKSRSVKVGDFLLSNSMSFGKPYILNIDGCIYDGWLLIKNTEKWFNKDFLYWLLSSDFIYNQFCGMAAGAVVKNLSIDKVKNTFVPIPPLREQERIVAKIEDIMSLIDDIEKTEKELLALETSFSTNVKNALIKAAVQGKLTEQFSADGDANALMRNISKLKNKLITGEKKKQANKLKAINEGEIPFPIPDNWKWVRLSEIGEIVVGGTPKTEIKEYWEEGNIPWLTTSDMKKIKGKYAGNGERFITQVGLKKSTTHLIPKGSVLYSCRAPIGYVAVAKNELCTNQGIRSIVPYVRELTDYIYYSLIALTPYIISKASGTTFQELSGNAFKSIIIPLPPLEEQKRIVKKLDELLRYCE